MKTIEEVKEFLAVYDIQSSQELQRPELYEEYKEQILAVKRFIQLLTRFIDSRTPMPKISLNPCPFCGSIDLELQSDYRDSKYYWEVLCNGCLKGTGDTKEEATESWNKRTDTNAKDC